MTPHVTQEYAELRRRSILEAAWRSFAEYGVRGTTMRGIAERLGLSTGILYTYFSSKQEILEALQEVSLQQNRALFAELERKATVREALETLFDYLLSCCPREDFRTSAQANLTSWAEALRTPAFAKAFSRTREQATKALSSIIRRGIREGELTDAMSPESAADAILAAVFGAQLQVALVERLDASDLLSTTRDLVLGGLPWRDQ
jgi:AcrR family transcriptional regulator